MDDIPAVCMKSSRVELSQDTTVVQNQYMSKIESN